MRVCTISLLVAVLGAGQYTHCAPVGTDSPAGEEVDNAALPIGKNVAILVAGAFLRGVTDTHMLPSLVSRVIYGLENGHRAGEGGNGGVEGDEENEGEGEVNVFVDIDPSENSGVDDSAFIRWTFQSQLRWHLKGLIIRHADTTWTPAPVPSTRTWNIQPVGQKACKKIRASLPS